jgi:ADP-ribose pyrophosphatase YjhB (NUDIX family)
MLASTPAVVIVEVSAFAIHLNCDAWNTHTQKHARVKSSETVSKKKSTWKHSQKRKMEDLTVSLSTCILDIFDLVANHEADQRKADTVSLLVLASTKCDDQESFELLVHRRCGDPVKSFAGRLGVPGGRCEQDETFWQAIVRETKEEAGLDLAPFRSKVFVVENWTNKRGRRHVSFGLVASRDLQTSTPLTVDELDTSFAPDAPNFHTWMPLAELAQDLVHPALFTSLQCLRLVYQ